MGPLPDVTGLHADGSTVALQIQGVSKDGSGSSRVQLRRAGGAGVGFAEGGDDSGSDGAAAASRPAASRAARAGSVDSGDQHDMHVSDEDDNDHGGGRYPQQQQQQQQQRGSAAGARFAIGSGAGRGAAAGRRLQNEDADDMDNEDAEDEGDWPRLQSGAGLAAGRGGGFRRAEDGLNPRQQQQQGGWRQQGRAAAAGYGAPEDAAAADAFEERGDDDAGSVGGWEGPAVLEQQQQQQQLEVGGGRRLSGGSEAESETQGGLDAASMSEAGEDDDNADITCDWRRAKRLRRIKQQLDSPLARMALNRFWRGMWLAAGVLLAAHIICFSILAVIVKSRQTDVFGVQQMAYAVDKSQMIMLRNNMVSKCGMPDFESMDVCSVKQQKIYLDKLLANVENLNYYHNGLFLGFNLKKVHKMADKRLLDWWRLPKHTETFFFDSVGGGNITTNTSLWDMGNKYIYAAREVGYAAAHGTKGAALEALRDWQYVAENGMGSVFHGYAQSLDMYVRFCWAELGKMGSLMIGLLVAEVTEF
ncbi:hypothetical protein OEZ85_009939 [Tetradesmus obliquus]|uniref:Uncharacterized protein n=1 Tax=Tetradesmus obliquus TaxID=3088 RepID=A0ABY8UBB9_TETOB|nr:hypothetical protein OEZ85_009939 [Tetradesmus obliquus]